MGVGAKRHSAGVRLLCATIAAYPLCLAHAGPGADRKAPALPEVAPTLRIPVEKLGYLPPAAITLTYRIPASTLNFIDDTHLLFTFHSSGLMRRMPNEPRDDQDQTIRALVLDLKPDKDAEGKELPPGHVSERTEWRMHDRNRYLWQLPHGRFLVRSRNTLYEIDRGLHFTPYVRTDTDLTEVDLSADRELLSLQSEVEIEDKSLPSGDRRGIRMSIIQTADDKLKFTSTNPETVHLPLIRDGYVGAKQEDRNAWTLMFYPFQGEPRKFAEVQSSCHPQEVPLNGDAVLVTGCTRDSDDHLEQVFTLDGRTLWQQRWSARYVWPNIEHSEDGSRFALASVELSHSIGVLDPVDETTINRQLVGVYDTATGQLRLVKTVAPILTGGQHFALSADGRRFAVLRSGAIEIYDLPPAAID